MSDKIIIIFTASYPYGHKETYFGNELKYLAEYFSEIYIIPIYNPYKNSKAREVPKNVFVLKPILNQGFVRIIDGIRYFRFNKIFVEDFFLEKVFLSFSKLKKWANSFFLYCKGVSILKDFEGSKDVYLYSYWAEIPFFIDNKFCSYKKIVRMHGGDFYLDRNQGYLPVRKQIYEAANLLLPISNDIKDLLVSQYKISQYKIFLSYLGVDNNIESCSVNNDERKIKFVSCSNVYGLKRVHLIYDILISFNSDIEIEWHHFGDGESMEILKEYIALKQKKNIKCVLFGHLNQLQIEKMYQNNYYNWFINVSQYEGLPVSIMESFSYGIPAIATNVGGTSEIVNDANGILINRDFSIVDLVNKIENIGEMEYLKKRVKAYETWISNFEGRRNYQELSIKIVNL